MISSFYAAPVHSVKFSGPDTVDLTVAELIAWAANQPGVSVENLNGGNRHRVQTELDQGTSQCVMLNGTEESSVKANEFKRLKTYLGIGGTPQAFLATIKTDLEAMAFT